ncbi:MAG TPA: metallophosphoesterase [Fimbriiglobus sp.]|nr:metallophosphoesterase [Fimbriiglobus sp.]
MMNRRTFLKTSAATAVGLPVAGACYGFAESTRVKIDRQSISLPRLPVGFRGTTAAFLTDIHLGPFVSVDYVAAVVRTTMMLNPDLVLLGGDYSHRDGKYIAPCFEVLARLSAPLGVYGVLGNHDYWHGLEATRAGMRSAKVTELTNRGVWLQRAGGRLRLAGVDDLWEGRPDLSAALGDARPTDACLLLSHNPDFAEALTDRRVGLVLSGHTHGGQVVVPGYGPPVVPSRYGQKYAHGLVEAPVTQVYVSAGIGMSGLPIRANCRPEITLITLV